MKQKDQYIPKAKKMFEFGYAEDMIWNQSGIQLEGS